MGRGVLTGKFDPNSLDKSDFRNHNPRFSGGAFDNVSLCSSSVPLGRDKLCHIVSVQEGGK